MNDTHSLNEPALTASLVARIHTLAKAMTRSDLAEDIAQEALLHVWQVRHRWRGTGPWEAFASRVARRKIIDLLRHEGLTTTRGRQSAPAHHEFPHGVTGHLEWLDANPPPTNRLLDDRITAQVRTGWRKHEKWNRYCAENRRKSVIVKGGKKRSARLRRAIMQLAPTGTEGWDGHQLNEAQRPRRQRGARGRAHEGLAAKGRLD